MKELDYQQRIRQLEEALRESEKREACVQERLKETELELGYNMVHVADLQELVERGQKELRDTKMRYEAQREQLMSELDDVCEEFGIVTHALADATKDKETLKTDNAIICEELDDVRNQLDIATRDLSDARKDKESLEVCYRSVRGMSSSMLCCVCYRSGGSTVEAG